MVSNSMPLIADPESDLDMAETFSNGELSIVIPTVTQSGYYHGYEQPLLRQAAEID